LPFAAAVSAEPDRLRSAPLDLRLRYSYLDRGRYLDQLQRVTERFPRSALHVLLFEDLRDTPTEIYRGVCQFLDVSAEVAPPNLGDAVNPFVTFRSRWLRRVSRGFPGPLRRVAGRLNARPEEYEPMDPTLRAELMDRFASPNAELAEWLGRDLRAWS
jgi:hypothetical protein